MIRQLKIPYERKQENIYCRNYVGIIRRNFRKFDKRQYYAKLTAIKVTLTVEILIEI